MEMLGKLQAVTQSCGCDPEPGIYPLYHKTKALLIGFCGY